MGGEPQTIFKTAYKQNGINDRLVEDWKTCPDQIAHSFASRTVRYTRSFATLVDMWHPPVRSNGGSKLGTDGYLWGSLHPAWTWEPHSVDECRANHGNGFGTSMEYSEPVFGQVYKTDTNLVRAD